MDIKIVQLKARGQNCGLTKIGKLKLHNFIFLPSSVGHNVYNVGFIFILFREM